MWPHLLERWPQGLAPIELAPGVPAWLMLTWDLNQSVLADDERFSRDAANWQQMASGAIPPGSPLHTLYQRRRNAMSVDGQDHQRYRAAMHSALVTLTGTSGMRVKNAIADTTSRVLSPIAARGQADLIRDYATQVPLLTLCQLFGMSYDEGQRACSAMGQMWDEVTDMGTAYAHLRTLMGDLARHRRAIPGNDLTTGLINQGLTHEEVLDHLVLVVAAGADPIANLIGNTLRLVFTQPETAGQRSTRELLNMSLWREPPLQTLPVRYPRMDVQLGGTHVAAGDCLVLGVGPAHHQMMARADLDRMATNQAHLIWGSGGHACPHPGQQIALIMAEHAVDAALALSNLTLEVWPQQLEWRPSLAIRGLQRLPVRFTPRP